MKPETGQLTVRGIAIGCIGCIVITATSAYTALKMGALPWPIIFAAIISLFFLKALGNTSLNEANVTHTIMSAGAMVAGGLAFTIPGIWILSAGDVDALQMFAVALSGVVLGLVCTAVLRRHFIEDVELEFPIGEAAAQTLRAGDAGGRTGAKLFGAMGVAGVYTALRDGLGMIPAMLFGTSAIPGVAFGIYNSPMMLAVGFLVGTASVVAWFAGALLGNFGIIAGGSAVGLWDVATGQGIVSSLGMGVMMGCGVAVIVKDVLPKGVRLLRDASKRGSSGAGSVFGATAAASAAASRKAAGGAVDSAFAQRRRKLAVLGVLAVAAVALILCFVLGLGPVASVVVVALVWVTCAMAAQSVGQTGIDPMEIFGLIVLLGVAAVSSLPQVQLFFVAGVIAVGCGLAGDVMNDFHAGHVLGTSPEAQWKGQAIGGILGAVVATGVMLVLVEAYGTGAFGPNGTFIAAQASVVATMVSGIPSVPAFALGLVVGFALYFAKFPAMMLGLGIYLPFYMSFSAFLGAVVKLVWDAVAKRRREKLPEEERAVAEARSEETGLVVASGVLGGESIVGVVIAFLAVAAGLGA